MSEDEKYDLSNDLNNGQVCYKKFYDNKDNSNIEKKIKFKEPKEYFKYFLNNTSCDGDKSLCVRSAAFSVKSFVTQLCKNVEETNNNDLKTEIYKDDFFKLLEIGENCYKNIEEYKSYVKNPAFNYNNCFQKCIENTSINIDLCTQKCYEHSVINIFKICELSEENENEGTIKRTEAYQENQDNQVKKNENTDL